MRPPTLSQPAGPSRARSLLLGLAAGAVIASSLFAGLRALALDLRYAYRNAGPSVFADTDRRQMATVRAALSSDETILLLGTANTVWHARLWQRGMYPRNPVVVRLEPYDGAAIRSLRERYGIRHAVLLGPPAPDPGFQWSQDLGSLPGLPERVSFGELLP